MSTFGPPQPTPNKLAKLSVSARGVIDWLFSGACAGMTCTEVHQAVMRKCNANVYAEVQGLIRHDDKIHWQIKKPEPAGQRDLL